jgi:hypothetical protein
VAKKGSLLFLFIFNRLTKYKKMKEGRGQCLRKLKSDLCRLFVVVKGMGLPFRFLFFIFLKKKSRREKDTVRSLVRHMDLWDRENGKIRGKLKSDLCRLPCCCKRDLGRRLRGIKSFQIWERGGESEDFGLTNRNSPKQKQMRAGKKKNKRSDKLYPEMLNSPERK